MKTPVLATPGLWMSVEFPQGIHRLCCPQTHSKPRDLQALIHLQGKTATTKSLSQKSSVKAAGARHEFSSLFRCSLLPLGCQAQLTCSGHHAVGCPFPNLAVVRGKSAPWVELVDAREGLISSCFWQPALGLMFDGSLGIYKAHPGTSKSAWPCRASEGALFKRGQAARCLLCP